MTKCESVICCPVGLQCVIMVFPGHALFLSDCFEILKSESDIRSDYHLYV